VGVPVTARPFLERAQLLANLGAPATALSEAGVRLLKFHCARHTFITWALESGKSAKRISTWVGASEEVIQSNYSHLLPDDGGVDFLGAVFGTEKPHQTTPRKKSKRVTMRKDVDPGAIRTDGCAVLS
jgi:hypothetical protein